MPPRWVIALAKVDTIGGAIPSSTVLLLQGFSDLVACGALLVIELLSGPPTSQFHGMQLESQNFEL